MIYEFSSPVMRIGGGVFVLLAVALAVAAGSIWVFVGAGVVPLLAYGFHEHFEIDPQKTHLAVRNVWSIWPCVPLMRFGIARAALLSDLVGVAVVHRVDYGRHGRIELWCTVLVLGPDGRFAHGIGGTSPITVYGFKKRERAEQLAAQVAEEFKLPVLPEAGAEFARRAKATGR